MAQQIRLVDDIDKATEAAETLEFSFRGKDYAIDLSAENIYLFNEQMAHWIGYARKAGRPPATVHVAATETKTVVKRIMDGVLPEWSTPPDASHTEKAEYTNMRKDARAWAIDNGWPKLSAYGRVPDAAYAGWKDAMGWKGNLFASWSNHLRKVRTDSRRNGQAANQ